MCQLKTTVSVIDLLRYSILLPHMEAFLIKDIISLERVQRLATKLIYEEKQISLGLFALVTT